MPETTWQPSDWEKNVHPSGDWVLQGKTLPRSVMGKSQEIVWADGESLFIVADTGYGKSTLAQNIVRAGIGLLPDVLTFTVRHFERVLYIAADRPNQIRYSLARMISEDTRSHWNQHVHINEGPLPFWINEKPDLLSVFSKMAREKWGGKATDCLVIDSLKDIATALSDDEEGIKVNAALQAVCREGIQLLITHHPRKAPAGERNRKGQDAEPSLNDVFGSKFLTGGAGSVIYLHNLDKEYDSLEVTHLKSPAGEIVFPRIKFDKATGMVDWAI